MIRLLNHYVPRGALVIAGFEALILAFSLYLAMLYWPGESRYYLGAGLAAAAVIILVERLVLVCWKRASPTGAGRPGALVLGAGTRAALVDAQLRMDGGLRAATPVLGYLPVNEAQCHVQADRLIDRRDGESLRDLARRHGAREIIVGVRDRRNGGLPVEELLDCRLGGLRVMDLTTYVERERGQVLLESLNASWLIFGDGFRRGPLRDFTKRVFDLVLSALLILVALPLMAVTALAILVTSGRPVLYWQERVGRDGRVFRICKFRSMRTDAEGDGRARWAEQDDDRITPVGRIIRKLRIDELPQVYNVLRGDMSFVGPRPERPEFVALLAKDIPFYQARHSVKPGITGWAQVCHPYTASMEATRGKLQYDLYYVKNGNLLLDLKILLRTVQVVILGRGSR